MHQKGNNKLDNKNEYNDASNQSLPYSKLHTKINQMVATHEKDNNLERQKGPFIKKFIIIGINIYLNLLLIATICVLIYFYVIPGMYKRHSPDCTYILEILEFWLAKRHFLDNK